MDKVGDIKVVTTGVTMTLSRASSLVVLFVRLRVYLCKRNMS